MSSAAGAISRPRRHPGITPPGNPGRWFGAGWFGMGWFGVNWFR